MTQGIAEVLAAEVRRRRAVLRLTQQDLAQLAGVSERFVRFVEQGKPSVQLDSLVAVLETLGLELKVTARNSQAARAAGPPVENSPGQ
ncbi:type II toxin-antitoxin system Y4mF family antitoxin [Arthrobacter sp. KFRI-F3372]|uniref:type II toxin-antitoxin system Y4mF family antitoxin n=1 Tax=Pseudarthrobacter oxydans TaxID=1671 RepID=UPI0027A749B5|nr:type II toxin-antitoxin system Y4mF family antitoxin [Arthrobacter sp. KFRI-F3372]